MQKVRCIVGCPGLKENCIYEVAVLVLEGIDRHGPITTPGYILNPYVNSGEKARWEYPYVWDCARFETVEEGK